MGSPRIRPGAKFGAVGTLAGPTDASAQWPLRTAFGRRAVLKVPEPERLQCRHPRLLLLVSGRGSIREITGKKDRKQLCAALAGNGLSRKFVEPKSCGASFSSPMPSIQSVY